MAIVAAEKDRTSVEQHEFIKLDKDRDDARVDYSGAHDKTDPEEIKLVRKLDLFIMPTLWFVLSGVQTPDRETNSLSG